MGRWRTLTALAMPRTLECTFVSSKLYESAQIHFMVRLGRPAQCCVSDQRPTHTSPWVGFAWYNLNLTALAMPRTLECTFVFSKLYESAQIHFMVRLGRP